MDEKSLTRTSTPSTKQVVADEAFCSQIATLLLCREASMRDAFLGEPVEEVLEMTRWALSHEGDEGFDAEVVLTGWAEKRGRGRWSERYAAEPKPPEHNERDGNGGASGALAEALLGYWSERPEELAALLDKVSASLNGRAA
jgi:hypothetical protein